MHPTAIRAAVFPADRDAVQQVLQEYVAWLDVAPSARFTAEMAATETLFSPPSGRFFLAEGGGELAGCVAYLRQTQDVAELKRLFVREAHRGQALGEQLVAAVVAEARALGFARLVLDTVPKTTAAQRLYARLGFTEIAPYYADAPQDLLFFELALRP